MKETKNKSNGKVIIFIFIMMILSAISENMRGVFIPIFQKEFLVSNTNIGLMLMISSFGYMISSYIGGMLCEKIGQKKVFIIGIGFMIISLSLLRISNSFSVILLNMFLMNIGLALIGIAINTVVPVLFLSFQAIFMNLTHFCYGVGATVGQRIAGILTYRGVGWRHIYLYVASFYVVILIISIFIKIPELHKKRTSNTNNNILIVLGDKLVWFYILALGFYVFAEMGTGSWFVNFMESSYSYNKSISSLYLALFFGIFTVGRLIGGFIVERLGYLKCVCVFLIIATVLYITGLSIGSAGTIIISISGFFFSITFPTVILTISKVFKENSAYVTGVIIAFMSIINMILNLTIGYLNDCIGVKKAFYIIPFSLFISSIFLYLIYIGTRPSLSKKVRR